MLGMKGAEFLLVDVEMLVLPLLNLSTSETMRRAKEVRQRQKTPVLANVTHMVMT